MLASNKEERKKWTEASKALQDTYWDYCKKNDYAVAEWRTRIAINEREGIKSGAISGRNNEYIPNKYFNGGSSSNLEQEEEFTQNQSKIIDNKDIPKENKYKVDEVINTANYHKNFEGLTGSKKLNENLYNSAIDILKTNNGTDYETLKVLDARTGKLITTSVGKESGKSGLTNKQYNQVKEYNELALVHNHPNNTPPSIKDIQTMFENPQIKYSIVACHNGDVYKISNMNRKIDLVKEYQLIYNEVKTKYMVKDYVLRITKDEFLLKAKQHGWFNFEVFKNGKKE